MITFPVFTFRVLLSDSTEYKYRYGNSSAQTVLENHLSLLVETVFVDIDSHSLFSMQIPFNAATSTVYNKVSPYWNHLHIFLDQ